MDVTAQRQSEGELLRVNDQLSLAHEMAGVSYWIVDLMDNRLIWSEGVYKIHGLRPDQYTPDLSSAVEFYHPDDRAAISKKLDAAIETGEPFEFEARLIHQGGETVRVHSKCRVQTRNGKRSAVVGVFRQL